MSISNARLAWFRLKCPYPYKSPQYKQAYAQLNNATYADLEKLRAEFDEFDDGSTPVIHYQHKGQWYAKVGLKGSPQKLNMRGIHYNNIILLSSTHPVIPILVTIRIDKNKSRTYAIMFLKCSYF